jgi:hypothetical protein
MIATKKNKEEGETRVAVLLTAMGRDRRRQDIQVIHLGRSRAHSKNLTKVLDAFTNYYKPKTNETYERFQFSTEEAESWSGRSIQTYFD